MLYFVPLLVSGFHDSSWFLSPFVDCVGSFEEEVAGKVKLSFLPSSVHLFFFFPFLYTWCYNLSSGFWSSCQVLLSLDGFQIGVFVREWGLEPPILPSCWHCSYTQSILFNSHKILWCSIIIFLRWVNKCSRGRNGICSWVFRLQILFSFDGAVKFTYWILSLTLLALSTVFSFFLYQQFLYLRNMFLQ